MTKTQAAETMALDVVVWARQNGRPVTKTLVEERISECACDAPHRNGTHKQAAARLANVTTTLRIAQKMEQER